MKKIIQLLYGVVLLTSFNSSGQNIEKDFFDGQVYMKIKNATFFAFDTSRAQVNVNEKLSFLNPLVEKYKIGKVEASFYFSRSEILKRTFRIYFENRESVKQFLADLQRLPQVDYAEKISIMRTDYTPNDLKANSSGSLGGQYGLYNIHAQDAWDVARGTSSTVIAVVDIATEISHSDLAGIVSSSRDVADGDDDPSPPATTSDWWHGTHTSGIACAKTNNSNGIASIGFGCSLMAIKVCQNSTPGSIGYGYEGIAWAASNGADVISCSWGNYTYSAINQAVIDDAYSNNAIVVASAGNDNITTTRYPAGYNHVLSVAATDMSDKKASFSNYGSWIDVSAPGADIYSSIPGNNYWSLSGTSMSTPMVAGLCGLIRSLDPSLSYDDVVNCVVSNTDNIDASNPDYIGELGSGRINAYRAVECALPCNASINLGSGNYSTLKTESSGTITSSNTISSGNQVMFDAATLVNLKPGFVATSGCTFLAYIDGCVGARLASYEHSEVIKDGEVIKNNTKIENQTGSLNVKCYPNPFSSIINLSYTSGCTGKLKIDVMDIQGKIVRSIVEQISVKGIAMKMALNLADIPSGIYILKVSDGTNSSVQKIIKM